MGLDFLRRTAKSSTKAWDRGKLELSMPSLFSQQPDRQSRAVQVDCFDGIRLSGTEVTLHLQGQNIVVVQENMRVGMVERPPPDLVANIREAGGCALGQVQSFNELSWTADVKVP
jgi:hypothetical protein